MPALVLLFLAGVLIVILCGAFSVDAKNTILMPFQNYFSKYLFAHF